MKTFVIGDIHGNHKALLQCLERSGFDKEADRLIVLGDLCDNAIPKTNQTPEVIDELMTIKDLILIRGNHDVFLEEWLMSGIVTPLWQINGYETTVDAYQRYGNNKEDDSYWTTHLKFIQLHHKYYIDDNNRCFVHGGFTHEYGPVHEIRQDNLWWDRSLYFDSFKEEQDKRLKNFREIFIGHTTTHVKPAFSDKPVNNYNLFNIDTGAGHEDGRLTIMNVYTKEFWQSDKNK